MNARSCPGGLIPGTERRFVIQKAIIVIQPNNRLRKKTAVSSL